MFDAHKIATGAEHFISQSDFKIKAYKTNNMNYYPRAQTTMSATFIGENSTGDIRKKHFAIVAGNIF